MCFIIKSLDGIRIDNKRMKLAEKRTKRKQI
jgi:hypothetical protein